MSNNSFLCPFCNNYMSISDATHSRYAPSFSSSNQNLFPFIKENLSFSTVIIDFFKCPNCNKYSIILKGVGSAVETELINIFPNSLAKKFPKYIPPAIREDYEEAYAILHLSPKASATLCRRCLQGMIRDFHGIIKSRLVDEINALKDIVPPSQWKAIDGIRSIGNIGAHMESNVNTIVDVEPFEAEKLLKLIELLIDKWYIARHDEEELFNSITEIADDKKVKKLTSSQ